MENLSIRFWAEDDRPREKMMLKGRNALSNAELIAILIGSGTRKKSAIELSQEILNFYENDLRTLSKATRAELCKFDGIGEAKAISILAAMELARRREKEPVKDRITIRASKDAFNYLKPILSDLYQEEFHTIFVNSANKIIRAEQISIGGFAATFVDAKVVFQKALEHKATGLVLAHNHPSGSVNPSDSDIRLTQKLVEISKLIEIRILDHIIVGDNEYYSFIDNGLL